jgi:hypothetical protein
MKKLSLLFAVILLAGAVLWNGWVFGFFNHGMAGYIHMSISELEVVGQPHAGLFNLLEDISGICMIVGAFGLIAISRRFNSLLLVLLCIAAIGGLTLYDVAHPLDCNRYNNPVCVARINANEVSHSNVLHNDESRITAYITIVLALLIAAWAHLEDLPFAERIGLIAVALAVVIALILFDTDGNVLTNSISERVWNVLVSAAIGYVAWKLLMKPKHLKRRSARS